MIDQRAGAQPYPVTRDVKWRHRFTLFSVLTSVALIGWGGFVTSIDAGLAVPDWPSSFNSYDPFNPWPDWWTITPVLAEHGHRLLGALVGLFTLVLAVWTGLKDPRRWMRLLGYAALALVIFQGVLGGLRVVWVSLDLAVVHSCVAQIFFSTLVAMALFTTKGWLQEDSLLPASKEAKRLRTLALVTVGALYLQIILGALLRHPGTGIDPALAGLHMGWAFVAATLILATFGRVLRHYWGQRLLNRSAWFLLGLVGLQIALGFTAYFVLLDERGMLRPSNVQVIVNSSHLIVGALLFASAVALALLALRRPTATETPPVFTESSMQPVAE